MDESTVHVTIEKGTHNGKQVLFIYFAFNKVLVQKLKELAGTRWSNTKRCWYGPGTNTFYQKLKAIKGILLFIKNAHPATMGKSSVVKKEPPPKKIAPAPPLLTKQKTENVLFLNDIEHWTEFLKVKKYAERSIIVYKAALLVFLQWLGVKNHKEVRKEDIREFMKHMVFDRKISRSYQNQIVNALKSFYQHTYSIHMSAEMIERPRKSFTLPRYLTQEEVKLIFQALRNLKHRAMISLMYACGLRVGEIIRIRISDIDAAQRLLQIRQAKGAKDRVVPIPESILKMLNDYAMTYQPKVYLFEGQFDNNMYTERSVQQLFKNAVKRSGIRNQAASPHWLRHSYATHIMEMGTNLRDLQILLGHKSLKTTEIYTHISATNYNRIISPFDTLPENKEQTKLEKDNKKKYF